MTLAPRNSQLHLLQAESGPLPLPESLLPAVTGSFLQAVSWAVWPVASLVCCLLGLTSLHCLMPNVLRAVAQQEGSSSPWYSNLTRRASPFSPAAFNSTRITDWLPLRVSLSSQTDSHHVQAKGKTRLERTESHTQPMDLFDLLLVSGEN